MDLCVLKVSTRKLLYDVHYNYT